MTLMQRICVVLLVAIVAVDARLHQPPVSTVVGTPSPCTRGCPVFTQPTFYVSTKAPVTADQVSATQQWWSMVAQLPQVPSTPVYTAFASTFALARNVSKPFLTQALPSALGAQASILNATATCYSAVNKTAPALISMCVPQAWATAPCTPHPPCPHAAGGSPRSRAVEQLSCRSSSRSSP